MARKEIRISLDRENRNDVNSNFKELYDQLHDITGTITDEIIQEILDEALENSKLVWKEYVDTFDELPDVAGLGEVHYVVEEKIFYRWDGEEWTPIQQIDMDVMTEMEERLELLISSNTESVEELRVDVNSISEDVSATKGDIVELREEFDEVANRPAIVVSSEEPEDADIWFEVL